MAFYQQAIWNTTQGRFLEVSATDFSNSLLGTDVILIYALMSPFYLFVPSPLTLVIVETVVVASGAIPLYWLARQHLDNTWLATGFGLLYLLMPAVQDGNLYELRERPMAGAFLLYAFYFWHNRHLRLFAFAATLALCCRPENGLVLVMLGLYGWLEKRQNAKALGWKFVLTPTLLGLGWFAAALLIIQLATGGNGFALGSTFAGGSPLAAVTTVFTNPPLGLHQLFPTDFILFGKLLYIPLLILPLAGLPLVAPRALLMALPPVGLNLIASEQRQLQWTPFDYHYQGSVIVWLLIASVFAVEKIVKIYPKYKLAKTLMSLALVFIIATNLFVNLAPFEIAGVPRVKHGWGAILRSKAEPRSEAGLKLLASVPDDAPLAISNVWAIQAKPRRELWYLAQRPLYSMHPTQKAQFVFADVSRSSSEEAEIVRALQATGEWQITGEDSGYILLRRL